MPKADDIARWYAIRTRSRHEKQVRDRLAAQGVEQLLPTVIRLNQWKDRKKEVGVPLLSGYCFARFSWQARMAGQKVSGVAKLWRGEDGPEPVPRQSIAGRRNMQSITRST